jgi:hypothetical protein
VAHKRLTKQQYLKLRAEGVDRLEICRRYGYASGTIKKWRQTDLAFRERYDAIEADLAQTPIRVEEIYQAGGEDSSNRGKKVKFLKHYLKSDDRIKSVDAAGLSVGLLLRYLDPENSKFDEAFAEAVEEIEARQAIRIEDKARMAALIDNSAAMQKFILPHLPIVGKKYAPKRVEGGAKTNILLFTSEGIEKTIRVLKDVTGKEKLPA